MQIIGIYFSTGNILAIEKLMVHKFRRKRYRIANVDTSTVYPQYTPVYLFFQGFFQWYTVYTVNNALIDQY